jgi:hypothetical protein
MKTHVGISLAGLLFLGTAFLTVGSAFAQSANYTCACSQKSKEKTNPCTGGALTVTVKATGNVERAATNQCFKAYGKSCRRVSCFVTVTSAGVIGPGDGTAAGTKQVDEKTTGIADEHADGLAKFADDNDLTIIIRTTNPKSLRYQDEDKSKYRPKPLTLSAIKTQPTGKYAGLIVKPDWSRLIQEEDPSKKKKDVDDEVKKLQRDCKKVKSEDRGRAFCGWYLDNKGVVRDEKKRAVFGDYDMQGVYKGKELVDTNDSKQGKALRQKLNEAMDKSRTKRDEWLIQHGANDNYRKKGKMGREPEMDEDFMVFNPDGRKEYIADLAALKKYYDNKGFPWPYKCPAAASCKKK